ncbi:MAG TPA: DUF4012 domain-containing protein [Acidimicrobiales bacterium]
MNDALLLIVVAPGAFALAAVLVWASPAVVATVPTRYRLAVALVSGLLAVPASAAPTELAGLDVALRAVFAFVVTFVASRSRSRPALIAAGVAAVAAWHSPLHAVALAAAGVMVAVTLTNRRRSIAVAVVAVALVQVALRLEWPSSPHGATAMSAAVVLVPVVVSGLRAAGSRRGRREQRLLRRGAAFVVAAGAGLSLVAAFAAVTARPALEAGARQAKAGIAAARKPDPATANRRLEEADASFRAAARSIDSWWVRPAWALPVVGQHLRSLRSVAQAGQDLSASGSKVSTAASVEGLRIEEGQVPVDRIAAVTPAVGDAVDALERAITKLRGADSPWLLPMFDRRVAAETDRLDDALGTATRTHQALQVLPSLLGAGEPRRYFLLVQTPAELRGTGGFMGNFGEITAVNGKLELVRFGRTRELNAAGDPTQKRISGPPDYVARYERFEPATTWQNVTMSPDFPTVARVVGELYPQSGGTTVDGVLALDPAGLAALLRVTGPVRVQGWPEPLSAKNAEKILLHDQYVEYASSGDRVDFLGDAARSVWQRLTSGSLPQLDRVARSLGPAVAQKRIMFASLRPGEAGVLESLGVAGEMADVDGDFLAVVAQNASASKIDWFLRRSVQYEVEVDDRGALTATATIALRNEAPPSGLPPVIIGSSTSPPLPMGTNRLYVSLYSPWGLTGATLNGEAIPMESERELGRRVYSTYVDVPPGSSGALVVRLGGRFEGVAPYALTVHRQPTVAADEVTVRARLGSARVVDFDGRLVEDERVDGAGGDD